jgi:hypothetical protein
MVEEGYIRSIKVEFTPTGFTSGGVPDERMIALEGSGLESNREYPLGILSALADRHNLIPLKGKAAKSNGQAKAQPLPAKTLTKEDLSKTPQEFAARARAVADACEGGTLVGRVRTSGAFNGSVTTSFQNWWRDASPRDRMSALVIPSKAREFTDEDVQKFSNLPCPFRGTAEFRVQEDDDEEEDEDEPEVTQVRVRTPQNQGSDRD